MSNVTAADSPPESLLRYCAVWNTNARNCQDAQAVLQVLLTHVPPEELLQYQGARAHLEGLIPYTGERRGTRVPPTAKRERGGGARSPAPPPPPAARLKGTDRNREEVGRVQLV